MMIVYFRRLVRYDPFPENCVKGKKKKKSFNVVISSSEDVDELTFKSGELIMLKSWYGKDWFRGKLINGKEGIFPKNFVEVVVSLWCTMMIIAEL